MNIVTAVTADNAYVRYLSVMLFSLFVNNADESISVYVLHDGLADEDIAMLDRCTKSTEWCNNKNIIPVFVDKNLFCEALTTEFSIGTYFRLMMFDLLPDSVERALYLDVDLIVNGSLNDFYYMDFGGCCVMACSHGINGNAIQEMVNAGRLYPERGECFNAGVVLYDFKTIRKEYNFDSFKKYIGIEEVYYDQGILNLLFWDKAKYLPTEIYNNRGNNHDAKIEDSLIIHYADANPWEMKFSTDDLMILNQYEVLNEKKRDCLNNYYFKMVSVWWEYAKHSEYYLDFCREADVMHKYFMDRIVKNYFHKMEKEYNLLKFKEKLLEMTLDGSLVRALKVNKGIDRCSIYGMGYFGTLLSRYLSDYIDIPYYIDRFKRNTSDIEYRRIDQLDDEVPVIVCVWNPDKKMVQEIKSNTSAEVITMEQLLGDNVNA